MVEFGEKYLAKLVLKADDDEFKRPAYTWFYDKKDIGSYVDYDLFEGKFTVTVDGRDFYNLLGKSMIEDNDVTYYHNDKVSSVIEAKTMVKATPGTGNFGRDTEIKLDEIASIEDVKKDDRFLVQVAWGDSAEYDIVRMLDVESQTDVKLNKYSSNKYVVSAGTQYDYAKSGKIATYSLNGIHQYNDKALVDYTYNLYFDQYGYLIGNEIYAGTDNYVFITGYDLDGSHLAAAYATAGAIFLDGTMSNIQVDVSDINDNIDAYATQTSKNYYTKLLGTDTKASEDNM